VEDNRKGEYAKDGRKSLDALARDMHETYCQQGRSTFLAMASERFGQMQSETLVGMLHHQGELVRWYACKGLEHLHKSESVGHLVEAAKDKSPLVRGAAIEALVSIGGEQTVPTFIKLLSKPQDFFDRRHTLEALGDLRDPKAIPALWACYENADNTQVFKVAESLLMLGDTKIIPDLLYLVGKHTRFYPNQEFFSEKCDCSTAINLLGTYKVNAAVAGLIEALDCNYGPVREDAAWALGEIGDPTASRPLLAAMTRKRSLVVDKAIEALGKIGDPEIIPDLVAIFDTGTPAMARRASMALELMPEEAIRDHQHVISNIRAKREGESVSIAAPDLLRDLKAMVEALERTPDGQPPHWRSQVSSHLVSQAKRSIAKAEGRLSESPESRRLV
jgi:HEAT repeat protein